MLVYDITRRTTFENLKKWLSELRDFGKPDMVIVLIGNKSDLGHSREVGEEEGKTLAEAEGLCFMETSALENMNVEEAFLQLITRIHQVTTQKTLQVQLRPPIKPLQGGKEIIHIDHEVSATKHPSCCST